MPEKQQMGVLASLGYLLRTVWRADRGCVLFSFYKQCSEELFLSFFVVYFTRTLYGIIEQGQDFMSVVWLALVFCSLHVLIHVASAFHAYYLRWKTPEVYRQMFSAVMDKAGQIELRRYEQPDFYNRFARALDECLTKTMDGLFCLTLATGEGLGVIMSIIIVATIDPLLILFLLPPVLASFWLGGRRNQLQFELGNRETPFKRNTDYAKRVFYEKKYAGEVRLYRIREVLFRQHRESAQARYGLTARYNRRIFRYQLAQQLLMFCLMSASISLYVAWVLKLKGGAGVAAYTAILVTSGFITWKAGDTVQKAIEAGKHSIFMNNLRDFLEEPAATTPAAATPAGSSAPLATPAVPETVAAPRAARPVPAGERLGDIEFHQVDFRYDGASEPVLHQLSLSIRQGERIALVGENGAGKTTLVKLLMGLYQPSTGSIRVNGREIIDWEPESYRSRFGTVFQDFQVFGLSLAENVLLRRPESGTDRDLVHRALEQAQFGDTLARLPQGIDTPVTREFDDQGFVCSGGQAQKIALARVFAKEPDIVILDEPSSALDPVAEFNLYRNMLQASEGRTVFFISHRLYAARLADRVFYLEQGRLVESGTHDALMARNGRYAALFELQARKYREEHYETVEGNALYGN